MRCEERRTGKQPSAAYGEAECGGRLAALSSPPEPGWRRREQLGTDGSSRGWHCGGSQRLVGPGRRSRRRGSCWPGSWQPKEVLSGAQEASGFSASVCGSHSRSWRCTATGSQYLPSALLLSRFVPALALTSSPADFDTSLKRAASKTHPALAAVFAQGQVLSEMAEGKKGDFVGKIIFVTGKAKNRQTAWLGPIFQRDIQVGILSPVRQTVCARWGAEGSFSADLPAGQAGFREHFHSMEAARAGHSCAAVPDCWQGHSPVPPAHPLLGAAQGLCTMGKLFQEGKCDGTIPEEEMIWRYAQTSEEKSLSPPVASESLLLKEGGSCPSQAESDPSARFLVAFPCWQLQWQEKNNLPKAKMGKGQGGEMALGSCPSSHCVGCARN